MPIKLSEIEVLERLFAPASSRAKSEQGAKSVVIATKEGERSATLSENERLVQRSCAHLKKLGISPGNHVVFCCENRLEFAPTLLACWALRARATLIDYRTDLKDVFAACKKMNAKLLFTSLTSDELDFAGYSEAQMQFKVLRAGDLGDDFDEAMSTPVDYKNLDMDGSSLALFTSGTTGAPKTAVHTLRTLIRNIIELAEAVDLPQGTAAVTPLPISHVFGLTVLLVTQVLGMKSVLTDLNPVSFIKAVHGHSPELIAALPQFYGALLSAPKGVINLKNAQLLLTGGAPLTVSLSEKFEETFGKRLNNGYGSTESKIFALNKDGPVLSVGRAIGQVKIEIIDSNGDPLPDGKLGEVRVTSTTLMEEYLNDEDKTGKVLKNGQYYTGDLGHLEDGYLFVSGRKDDLVLVAGAVVHAAEVEEVLRNYEQVKDVAVTAVPNKRLGQIVRADVVVIDDNAGREALTREFKKYCAEHLARHKRPMVWHFLGPHDELPKTLAGKVNKKELTEAYCAAGRALD